MDKLSLFKSSQNKAMHRIFKRIPKASLLFFLVAGLFGLPMAISATTPTPQHWTVYVGGQAMSGNTMIMTMGYFPEIITIDVGDSITFVINSTEPHTITFLSGNPPLNPFSPQALAPIGGSVYNGTGIVSSGLLSQGQNYTLTFTKPGVYVYQCLIHPGMMGVVIVNPAGTPYPMTQAQYDQLASQQSSQSLASGLSLLQQVNLPASQGPNGTVIWHVDVGQQTPVSTEVTLNSVNSKVSGSAILTMTAPGVLTVQVSLTGLLPGETYNVGIFQGEAEAGGKSLYNLNPVVGASNGTGSSVTTLTLPPLSPFIPTSFGIPSAGWYINVSNSGNAVAAGDIIFPVSSVMGFLPNTLTIHAGDTVVWTDVDPDEVHTVTFVPQGMPIPEFGTPISLIPTKGHIFNGTGYYNSGPMIAGVSYNLTFVTPGVYTYVCLLHDNMGMVGTIIVLPATPSSNPQATLLSKQISELNNTLNSLNSQVSQIGSLTSQVGQLNSQVSSLNSQVSQIGSLSSQISSLNGSQASYENSVNSKISSLYSLLTVLIVLVVISLILNIVLIARRR
ncbi:plastocyanin/azurin family copper-binding protein [Metallosphaera sedula]|uniref:cupredoxin domain-containing protein n=1 Tax=Metallosphaera sedula TaxID=43687 RepID=UPI001F063C9E|nr:plastocyanin/azurin family copper-binding protein [Metallosphaera sedula]MCH1770424.1 plastocyanin/azurin family copper-binding protein [Metallosphaera sedula]